MQRSKIRPPAVAGAFYPATPQELQKMIQGFLEEADPPELTGVRALIAPHAGYIYSGPIAAFGYQLLAQQQTPPVRAFVLAPSHRVRVPGVALGDFERLRTPLGPVPGKNGYLVAFDVIEAYHKMSSGREG